MQRENTNREAVKLQRKLNALNLKDSTQKTKTKTHTFVLNNKGLTTKRLERKLNDRIYSKRRNQIIPLS